MFFRLLTLVLTVVYPFIVWWGLSTFGLVFLAGFMVALAAMRYVQDPKSITLTLMLVCIMLAGASCYYDDPVAIKLYPVLVNGMMLFLFGSSLFDKETIIERFARIQNPTLPEEAVRYTRRLTQIWCAFFVMNGGIAFWTALYASDKVWALYNGAIAYGLIGSLFVGEWLYRKYVLKIQ